MHESTGLLAAGFAADIAIFKDGPGGPFRDVIGAEVEDVALVMRGGDVLSGDDALVDALTDNCDTLDVCGVTKRVCAQAETGRSLNDLLQQGQGDGYALFYCLPHGYALAGFGLGESMLLVTAAINVHHFIVDGFIWRLGRSDTNARVVDAPRLAPEPA